MKNRIINKTWLNNYNIILFSFLLSFVFSCKTQNSEAMIENQYSLMRKEMVKRQILARGVNDSLIINAMGSVPRHLFVPEQERNFAYRDEARSIGKGQTKASHTLLLL